MKFATVVFIVTSCVMFANAQFSKNLENLNVDMILKNDRILTNYIKCLLEKGPCTNEGRELRSTLPATLKTGCKNCSDKERRNSRKVILHLQEKRPSDWKNIEAKFDPTGEFTREFKKNVDA